jgi:putative endonuclease
MIRRRYRMRSKKNLKKKARVKAATRRRYRSVYHKKPWWLYILECSDKTLYVGIAIDVQKRLHAHNTGKTCRYTRVRKPLVLKYQELCRNHTAAMKRERQVKGFTRARKLRMIEDHPLPGSG